MIDNDIPDMRSILGDPVADPFSPYKKVYSDGSHYIAIAPKRGQPRRYKRCREDVDALIDSFYNEASRQSLRGKALFGHVLAQVKSVVDMPDEELQARVNERVGELLHNAFVRSQRFYRKGHLNDWNYFVTFTYNDDLLNEVDFRKCLKSCLSHFHTRRNWAYMGAFERGTKTERLHFHGLLNVPDGQMVGKLTKLKDYDTNAHRMQWRTENDFFAKRFGRNDFLPIVKEQLDIEGKLDYIIKYVKKGGEKIVYSRGIPTELFVPVPDSEIAGYYDDDSGRALLFDDTPIVRLK